MKLNEARAWKNAIMFGGNKCQNRVLITFIDRTNDTNYTLLISIYNVQATWIRDGGVFEWTMHYASKFVCHDSTHLMTYEFFVAPK